MQSNGSVLCGVQQETGLGKRAGPKVDREYVGLDREGQRGGNEGDRNCGR